MKLHAFGKLTPIATAISRVERATLPLPRVETVPVAEASGRVAARDLRAARDVPAVDRAHWDGYAVAAADTRRASPARPVALRLVAEWFAEEAPTRPLGRGETAAVATGATLPDGADGVAIFEEVVRQRGRVILRAPVRPGERVTPAGHDLRRGTVLARAGELLGAATLGAIAASGRATVSVFARPRVALLATGNELQLPGERPSVGGVFESNVPAMAALVRAAGGIPVLGRPVPDRPEALERALRTALRHADLVLTSGGSSVGERDLLPRLFPRFGRVLFHGLAVRPGKPTLVAAAGPKLLFGLPGHPASCLSNMLWLVVPTLRRLGHLPGPGWHEETAELRGTPLVPSPDLATVVPLEARGGTVRSTFRGSSAVTSLRKANGFVILPDGSRPVRPGRRLTFHRLDPPVLL